MAFSLRLDPQLATELDKVAQRHGISKSELIRRCLEEFLAQDKARPNAWELGQELFGRVGSGRMDLARNRKQIIKDRLHARSRGR